MGSLGMAARAVMVGCLAAVVLGIAYVIVERGDSAPTLTPVVRTPPVIAKRGEPTVLGKGRAALASGGRTGLWVTRQSSTGAPGRLIRFRLPLGAAEKPLPLDITPYALAVGNGSIWVVGTGRRSKAAVLERIDPQSGKVKAKTILANAPACVVHSFASCTPVVTNSGVWVPLANQIVRVDPSGTMADRAAPLDGNLWDMASDGQGAIWAIAELGLYRVDERTGDRLRWPIRSQLHGLQAGHIAVDDKALWISAFPRSGSSQSGRLIHVVPGTTPVIAKHQQRLFPGAGSLALVGGGLWLERYDGQGELDRLNQLTGALSGPFVSVPDDVIQIIPRNGDLWILSYRPSGNKRTVTEVALKPASSG